jgi:hypothetical protein
MHSPDVLIFGAGIAGLWTANRLRSEGFSVVVVESTSVGGVQTLASQGVIHGGMKYALAGALTDSSEALRDMPRRWRAALEGRGEIDLRSTRVTADHQILWSGGSIAARGAAFFASKTLTSRMQTIPKSEAPAPFDHHDFHGALYRLDEFALDVPSLIQNLVAPLSGCLLKADPSRVSFPSPNSISLDGTTFQPALTLFLAGEGNEALIAQSGVSGLPAMQRRPLHQVVVRHAGLPSLFGVCLGLGPKPRMVVTTHHSDGIPSWYLGGELAEASGVARSETAQIDFASSELSELFPWLDWSTADWSTVRINRAEALDKSGNRPSGVTLAGQGNILVGWPTKLAMAPVLADEILAEMKKRGLAPQQAGPSWNYPSPPMGVLPWLRQTKS